MCAQQNVRGPRFTNLALDLSVAKDIYGLVSLAVRALKHAGATDKELREFSAAVSGCHSDKQIAEEIKAWISTEGEYQP